MMAFEDDPQTGPGDGGNRNSESELIAKLGRGDTQG